MAHEVRKSIPPRIQNLLWGRAAGRCEFEGCNRELWKSRVTQRTGNKAEKAHIWSVGEDGPRGRKGIAADKIDDVENLMLVCHECHEEIDAKENERLYPSSRLIAMKQAHEDRIELVTGIDPSRRSHVLMFGANIGAFSSPLRFDRVTPAMLPDRYPATKHAIELGITNSASSDESDDFWPLELRNLVRHFDLRVRERLSDGTIEHLSVFARAPQPLLTALGVLLTDIADVDVYPLRRERPGFRFEDGAAPVEFETHKPSPPLDGSPALVFSISATVARSRIEAVLGDRAAVWHVTVPEPHNDLVQSRQHLATFRATVRPLLDQIKAAHGEETLLHIFPAMPIPFAVELGRIRMPKADMPWRIYDELPGAGFVPVIDVHGGTPSAHLRKENAA